MLDFRRFRRNTAVNTCAEPPHFFVTVLLFLEEETNRMVCAEQPASNSHVIGVIEFSPEYAIHRVEKVSLPSSATSKEGPQRLQETVELGPPVSQTGKNACTIP